MPQSPRRRKLKYRSPHEPCREANCLYRDNSEEPSDLLEDPQMDRVLGHQIAHMRPGFRLTGWPIGLLCARIRRREPTDHIGHSFDGKPTVTHGRHQLTELGRGPRLVPFPIETVKRKDRPGLVGDVF